MTYVYSYQIDMLVLEETTNKYTKGCIEHDDIFFYRAILTWTIGA